MKSLATVCAIVLLIVLSATSLFSDNDALRRSGIMNGNQIMTQYWNYGSFSAPGNRITDFVWQGLGYAYEINFFVGAEVDVPPGSHPDVIHLTENGQDRYVAHVISDGLQSNGGELSADLTTRWSWQPLATGSYWFNDFLNPNSDNIAQNNATDLNLDGQPDSWPDTWWRTDLETFAWPGLWGWNDIIAHEEFVYGMDDRDNAEFKYYPFPADTTRRGLGVQAVVRAFQLGGIYEDVLFVTFDLKNVSDKDLDKVLFGVWGDPHIGGPDDWRDDWQSYDLSRQLIYAWDDDGKSLNNPSIVPGYFGLAFVQTPGNASDGLDNDGDGLIDESQSDGIDNDHDWDAGRDDLGADGIAGTSDEGEGDGVPTVGEPNFEFKDMDEADMLGLTSMGIKPFSQIRISEDEKIWQALTPGRYDTVEIPGDYALMGGSGYFSLKKNESKRVGIIFVLGQDMDDLNYNLDYATLFYHDNLGSQTVRIPLTISTPQENQVFASQADVQWDAAALPSDALLAISYSTDNGATWKAGPNVENTGSYSWDVSALPNSAFYRLRLRSISPITSGFGESTAFFTVDHSGAANVPPEVFLNLTVNSTLSDEVEINYLAGDADGDSLSLQLIIASTVVHDTLAVSGHSWTLNSAAYPNGRYTITLVAFDGHEHSSTSVNVNFTNEYPSVADNLISRRSGHATGELTAYIFDETQLKGRRYFVCFNDSVPDNIQYSVYDSASGQCLIDGDPLPLAPEYGRAFDGLCLSFDNDAFGLDEDNSGWNASSQTDLEFHPYFKTYDPYDYDIMFYDHVVDTSVNNAYLPFRVLDVINNTYMKIATTNSGTWTSGNTFYILRGGESPEDIVWEIGSMPAATPPADGDVFHLRTHKPFASGDTLAINTIPLDIRESSNIAPQTLKLFQNYPNPFNNSTTIGFYLPQRAHVTLEIFTILGQKVATLVENDANAGEHRIIWNGLNTQGQAVSSGLYIYRLRTSSLVLTKKLLLVK